jgi:predicted DNA-binding WGR domain protein
MGGANKRGGETSHVIQLTRSKPSSNVHRFDVLQVAPTLFGQWGLIAEWGRVGFPDQVREQLFETESAAQAALTKRLRIKTKHGYIQTAWGTA